MAHLNAIEGMQRNAKYGRPDVRIQKAGDKGLASGPSIVFVTSWKDSVISPWESKGGLALTTQGLRKYVGMHNISI